MAPLVRVERRDPHQAMDTGLGREISIGVLANDIKSDRLDSGFFTLLVVERLRLETVLLGPSQIHAHEHLGPVLRLSAAGSGMDVHDRVQLIVLAGQQDLGLDTVDELLGFFLMRSKIIDHRLAFPSKLDEGLYVIQASGYIVIEFEALFEAGALLIDFAGAFLVGPEIGFRDLLLQLVELMLFRAGVKETSARPRCEFSTG